MQPSVPLYKIEKPQQPPAKRQITTEEVRSTIFEVAPTLIKSSLKEEGLTAFRLLGGFYAAASKDVASDISSPGSFESSNQVSVRFTGKPVCFEYGAVLRITGVNVTGGLTPNITVTAKLMLDGVQLTSSELRFAAPIAGAYTLPLLAREFIQDSSKLSAKEHTIRLDYSWSSQDISSGDLNVEKEHIIAFGTTFGNRISIT